MKALILAAGDGGRLGNLTRNKPKALVRLLGVPLIERVILTAKQAGISRFLIVCGYCGDKLKSFLGNGKRLGVAIDYVENGDWEKGNGSSACSARHLITKNFVLLMSDHIFDPRILSSLMSYETQSSIVLAVERKKPSHEDGKVLEKNGKIIAIGKHVEPSNCVDTGIFLCTPGLFDYIPIADSKIEFSDCVNNAAQHGDAEIFDIHHVKSYSSGMRKEISPWWVDVDTERDLQTAERLLIENASKNPSDALAAYVHKPIENKLVAFLSRFNITPNQFTIVVNILGYSVAALYLLGFLLPACLLSFIVGIVDGLDGKLARVKMKTSKLGSLEHSFDLLFEFSWFIALSIYMFRELNSSLALILTPIIILFISFYRHVYDQFRKTSGKSLDDMGNFERKFKRIAGRRNLYNLPLLAGILLARFYSFHALDGALLFILLQAAVTAIVYAARAIKHLKALDEHSTPFHTD